MATFSVIFYLSLSLILGCMIWSISNRRPMPLLALMTAVPFLIVLWSVISPGGFDFDVYQRWTDTFLQSSFEEILIYFKPPEFFLLPWLYISAVMGVPFYYLYALSAILLVTILFLLIDKGGRRRFLLLLMIFLSSPAAPFLLGNVIRQGYASLFILALPFLNLDKTWKMWVAYGVVPAFLHRSAIIILSWFTPKRWKWTFLIITLPVIGIAFVAFRVELILIYSFAKDYHAMDTELSASRTIMRSAFFAVPFLASLPTLWKSGPGKTWFWTSVFLCGIIAITIPISLKAADRFTYYLSPMAVGSLFFVSSRQRVLLVGVLLCTMTIGLMAFGGYDKHFSHEYYGIGIEDSLSPE